MIDQHGIQLAERHKQIKRGWSRSTGLVWAAAFTLLILLLLPLQSLASDPPSFNTVTVNRLHNEYRGDDLLSVLSFRFVDKDGDSLLDSVGVYSSDSATGNPIPVQTPEGAWRGAGVYSFYITLSGYSATELTGLRIPTDSLVIVTVKMQRGRSFIPDSLARTDYVDISINALDDIVPRNALSGVVYDDSLGLPVESAQVYCEEVNRRASTDSLGRFSLPLDRVRRANIHVWHPLYDSIRFDIEKEYVHSEKRVDVHFECRRGSTDRRLLRFSDSTALVLLGLTSGGGFVSFSDLPAETGSAMYTYAVRVGDMFGPRGGWSMTSCMPFRLIRTFPDVRALVQCVEGIFPRDTWSGTNFAFMSDSAIEMMWPACDAGATMTIQLLPDYSFPEIDRTTHRRPILSVAGDDGIESAKVDSCDIIRAAVERTHAQNMLYLLEEDYDNLSRSFAADFHASEDHYEPTAENLRKNLPHKRIRVYASLRLGIFFHPGEFEEYIHGGCGQSVYDR